MDEGTVWSPAGLDAVMRAETALARVRGLDAGSVASILSPSILLSSAVEKAATFELQALLRDRDPQVVANCICALDEILRAEGGMVINKQIIHQCFEKMKRD